MDAGHPSIGSRPGHERCIDRIGAALRDAQDGCRRQGFVGRDDDDDVILVGRVGEGADNEHGGRHIGTKEGPTGDSRHGSVAEHVFDPGHRDVVGLVFLKVVAGGLDHALLIGLETDIGHRHLPGRAGHHLAQEDYLVPPLFDRHGIIPGPGHPG